MLTDLASKKSSLFLSHIQSKQLGLPENKISIFNMTISQSHQDNDTNEVQIGMDKLTVSNNRPHSESPSQQKEVPLEKDEGRNIQAQNMPIVVCSMSLRLPGDLKTPSELYSFLINRRDARSAPDKMRFNSKTHLANSTGQHTAEGYFLRDEGRCFSTFFSRSRSCCLSIVRTNFELW